MILKADGCVLNFVGDGKSLWHHFMLDHLEVVCLHLVTSHAVHCGNMSPLIQTSADVLNSKWKCF
jgi:hypothetical protein